MQHNNNSCQLADLRLAAGLVLIGVQVSATAAQLEEVVVTAQKREQSLQDVPVAVTAVFPDEVRDYLGAGENIRALSGRVPGLVIESSNGRQSPRFYIRGLGNTDFDVNANQPVGFVYDDVFLENAILKSIPVFDIERIEVLKGPQGTLFGRNTPAGLVKVDSVKPSFESDGYALAGYGSRDTHTFEVALGGGISEQVAGRVSMKYLSRGDWIDNLANNSRFGSFDEIAYRGQLLWQPNQAFSGLLKVHGFQQDGNVGQPLYANALVPGSAGVRPGFDPTEVRQDSASFGELEHWGVMLNLEYQFGNGMTVTSITSYDTLEGFTRGDVDGGVPETTPAVGRLGFTAPFLGFLPGLETGDGLSDHYQFQQELRLSQALGRLFYQVGFFYFDEEVTIDNASYSVPGSVLVELTQNDQQTRSYAFFGQVDYQVTDSLTVTGGLRYTADDKELMVRPVLNSRLSGMVAVDDAFVNWNIAANYDLTDEFGFYARIGNASRGPVTISRFTGPQSAETETLVSYEGGFRAEFLDNRARWNTSFFFYNIEDQQLTATGGEANTNTLLNADQTTGKGFETELSFQATEQLRLNMNASYTDTEIKDDDLGDEQCGSTPPCTGLDPVIATTPSATIVSIDGNPLPRAPKWLFNFDAAYEQPVYFGTLYAQTDWNYRGDSNIFFHESVEFVADSRWLGGVRVGVRSPSDRLDVAFVGRNITNKIAVDGALNFINLTAFTNEPRFFGFEVRYDFL